jgi:hypothetical protein
VAFNYDFPSDTPSAEEINFDDPAAFSNADLANYNSGLEKLKHARPLGGRAGAEGMTQDAGLTPEEKAAVSKYADLAPNWQTPEGSTSDQPKWQQDGHDATYKPESNYTGLGDGATTPEVPAPVAGGEEGRGDLVVNTEAIKTFRQNLGQLQEILAKTQGNVEGMAPIKPGYFGLGGAMYRAIIGDGGAPGLQKNTGDFLHNTVNTFEKLMTDIDTMIKEYDTTEELSTLSAEKLNQAFDDAFTAMGTMSTPTA